MRALVQRVREARVTVAGRETGAIGEGLLVLVCAMQGDGEAEGIHVENGEFGADMDVSLVNQGPVTIWLDTAS